MRRAAAPFGGIWQGSSFKKAPSRSAVGGGARRTLFARSSFSLHDHIRLASPSRLLFCLTSPHTPSSSSLPPFPSLSSFSSSSSFSLPASSSSLLSLPRRFTTLSSSSSGGPIERAILTKVTHHLQPQFLEVLNESNNHNVPKHSETHFKVVVVSPLFHDKSMVERHRMVNAVLREELREKGVHALSIKAYSTEEKKEEWRSPPCLGGSKR
ncbi:BolA-like protein 1 [Balamuthia mandrillaris]